MGFFTISTRTCVDPVDPTAPWHIMTLIELTNTLAHLGVRLRGAHLTCVDAHEVTDAELAIARRCPGLKSVTLLHTPAVTGSFLAAMRHSRISRVHLFGVPLGDDACEHLAALPALTSLVLRDCHIGTKGLRALARCPRLERLELSTLASWLDVRALLDFAGHKHMRSVSIEAPGLQRARGLARALPKLSITLQDATSFSPGTP